MSHSTCDISSCCREEMGKEEFLTLWFEGNSPSSLPPPLLSLTHCLTKQRPQKAAAAEASCRDCCLPVWRRPRLCGGRVSCAHQSGSLCEAPASWGSVQTTSCYLKAGSSSPTSHQDCQGLEQCSPQAQPQLAQVWAAWESETSSCGKVQTFWLSSELFPTSSQGRLMHSVLWTRDCLGRQGPKWPTSSAAFDHCSLRLCWMNSVTWHTQWKKAGLLMKNSINNAVKVRETKWKTQMSYWSFMCWFSFTSIWAFCIDKLKKQYIRGRIC